MDKSMDSLRAWFLRADWSHPQRRVVPYGIGIVTFLVIVIGLLWFAY